MGTFNLSMRLQPAEFVVLIGLAFGVDARPPAPAPLNLVQVGGEEGVRHPAYVLSILSDLGTLIDQRQGSEEDFPEPESDTEDYEGRKRAIDFGLGRGYSGSQAAHHMAGIMQANFSGGPSK